MANSWQSITLEEFAQHQKGFAFKSKDYIETGIAVVRVSNLTTNSIDTTDLKYVSEEVASDKSNFKLIQNDIVIATVGSWPKNPASVVGKVIKVPKSCDNFLLNQNAVRFRVKSVDPHDQLFLYYLLKSKTFSDYIISTAQGSANQASITLKDIYAFEFKCPSTSERREIANILSAIDDKSSLNSHTNQTLEQMAQALFKSWFVDFDPVIDNALAAGTNVSDFPEALQHRADQRKQTKKLPDFKPLPDDIRALFPSEFEQGGEPTIGISGWIPKGWKAGNLSSLAKFTSNRIDGVDLKLDNYISTDNMVSNKGGVITASKVPDIKTTPSFKPGDILISNIRPYFQKIWFATFSGGRSNDVLGFEAKNEQCKEYLLNLLYQDVFFDYMMTTSKGSKMPRGDKKAIMDWPVVIPPSSLQKFFSDHVKNYYQVIPIRNKESKALSQLRDTLLPKLISGEITINKGVA